MATLPLVMSDTGLQPQAPADLRNQIVTSVEATNPDYTDNLPGSLIEDVCSTDVAAVALSDSFLVDLVNSVSPLGANPFLLKLFGDLYGLLPQAAANTSVYVVFSGDPGFVIVKGFLVSDGSYQYACMDGGIIGADGQSLPIYAVASVTGNWAVIPGSVNQLATSVPAPYQINVTNPEAGIPATASEDIADFRDRVLMAGLAASTGMARYAKTLLGNLPGVQKRLVSTRQIISTDPMTNGRYVAIVGGGDPYQVAYALADAMFWAPGLVAPDIPIVDIAPAATDTTTTPPTYRVTVTTSELHNLTTYAPPDPATGAPASGDVETIYGVTATGSMQGVNGVTGGVTVIDLYNFTMVVPFDPHSAGAYGSGGYVTPNPIVEQVTITDYPDTYLISFVIPVLEPVTMVVEWGTDSPNFVSAAAVAQMAQPALQAYINSLPAGTAPINIYDMTAIFLDAIATVLPAEQVTALDFTVNINGAVAAPALGTGAIYGDPNGFFEIQLKDIVVSQHIGGVAARLPFIGTAA
jgi:hypothetical protein